jgi:hypothetical protein
MLKLPGGDGVFVKALSYFIEPTARELMTRFHMGPLFILFYFILNSK